ncbi:MAG: protein kinase, partial [Planctomycetota bacterium]
MDPEREADALLGAIRDRLERGEAVDLDDLLAGREDLRTPVVRRLAVMRLLDDAYTRVRLESRLVQGLTVQTGEVVDGYLVLERIGSGGMGTVFRAVAQRARPQIPAGMRVALKIIHPHLLARPDFIRRFQREAEAGGRIQHANVVPTLGTGTLEGRGARTLYLVMELVEGRTLRALLETMGVVPEALLREIGTQIADGLAAIHAAGIVHRDLKPENVLIAEDHQVRIMDLGMARLVDETVSLTQDDQFAGSLHYAAPEQFQPGRVGAPADLYALGLTLYELAAGEHPFGQASTKSMLRAHLDQMPPPLSSRSRDVSAFLTAVVETLLAKAPGERFASAAELRDVLQAGEASAWWTDHQEAIRSARVPSPRIQVSRDGGIHGRRASFQVLWDAWQEALRGEGGTVLLEAGDGLGKTRLVDALSEAVRGQAATVLYGSYETAGGWGGLSASLVGAFAGPDLERTLARHLPRSTEAASAVSALLRGEPGPAGSSPLATEVVHASLLQLLRGLASEGPLLWILEDIHAASAVSRSVILSLAREAPRHRVLLVLTTRPTLPARERTHLSRIPRYQREVLARLTEAETVALLGDLLQNDALCEQLERKVVPRAGGIPLFVVETVRSLEEQGLIHRRPDGSCVAEAPIGRIEVPFALRSLIQTALQALSPEERAWLDLASVQGVAFDAVLLADAREERRVAVLRTLAEMERRSGVVRAVGRRHHFDHVLIRDLVYEELAPALRTEYHARLAEAAATSPASTSPGEQAAFQAHHHLRGSHPHAALPHME